jgi:hypothetical protein
VAASEFLTAAEFLTGLEKLGMGILWEKPERRRSAEAGGEELGRHWMPATSARRGNTRLRENGRRCMRSDARGRNWRRRARGRDRDASGASMATHCTGARLRKPPRTRRRWILAGA